MSASAHPDPGEHWVWRRLRQFWLVIPLVAILAALMMSDLGDFMGVSVFDASNPCALTDASQSSISARMYLPIARWALRYTPSPSVAIIYIDPASDPPEKASYPVNSPNIQRVVPLHLVFHLHGVVANHSSNYANDDRSGGRNIPGRGGDGRQPRNGSSQQSEELGLLFVEPCHQQPGNRRERGSQIGIEKCGGGH